MSQLARQPPADIDRPCASSPQFTIMSLSDSVSDSPLSLSPQKRKASGQGRPPSYSLIVPGRECGSHFAFLDLSV